MGRRNKFQRCSDGLCGALDCPRCAPGCDEEVTCTGCVATIAACDIENEWTACRLCGDRFCENCFDAGLLVNIGGECCFVCEDCVKELVKDALRDKARDNKDPEE